MSDITGIPQEIPRETIGASYGDALLAAEGAGLIAIGTTWAYPQRTLAPRPAHAALYDELYGFYRDLYIATAPLAHSLAALQNGNPPHRAS